MACKTPSDYNKSDGVLHAIIFYETIVSSSVQSCIVLAFPKLIQPTQTFEILMSVFPKKVYSILRFLVAVFTLFYHIRQMLCLNNSFKYAVSRFPQVSSHIADNPAVF